MNTLYCSNSCAVSFDAVSFGIMANLPLSLAIHGLDSYRCSDAAERSSYFISHYHYCPCVFQMEIISISLNAKITSTNLHFQTSLVDISRDLHLNISFDSSLITISIIKNETVTI